MFMLGTLGLGRRVRVAQTETDRTLSGGWDVDLGIPTRLQFYRLGNP